jgi:hypothetical protein
VARSVPRCRLFSYWLPLPIGLAAFGWHARRNRQAEPAPS